MRVWQTTGAVAVATAPYDQAARAGTAHAVPAFCDRAGALRVSTSISRPGAPLVTEGGASLLSSLDGY